VLSLAFLETLLIALRFLVILVVVVDLELLLLEEVVILAYSRKIVNKR